MLHESENPLDSRQLVRTWLYSYSACQSWATTNLWSQILDGISGKKFEILEFFKHENFWTLMFESLKSRQSRKLNKHEKSWNLNYAFKWDFLPRFIKRFIKKILQKISKFSKIYHYESCQQQMRRVRAVINVLDRLEMPNDEFKWSKSAPYAFDYQLKSKHF